MVRLAATALRTTFSETISRVAYQGERVMLERNGKAIAGLVSAEDLALLEELENRRDVKEARAALRNRTRIPWHEAKKSLGL
jgi:antitoxin (DNA-binding transcriptional repressor) of toxin-antitoxin stability system